MNGPMMDMTTVMSKFLAMGLPLEEVIRASTSTPAKAIGWGDRLGRLRVGAEQGLAYGSWIWIAAGESPLSCNLDLRPFGYSAASAE